MVETVYPGKANVAVNPCFDICVGTAGAVQALVEVSISVRNGCCYLGLFVAAYSVYCIPRLQYWTVSITPLPRWFAIKLTSFRAFSLAISFCLIEAFYIILVSSVYQSFMIKCQKMMAHRKLCYNAVIREQRRGKRMEFSQKERQTKKVVDLADFI